ncbi:conserved hypothetical protein [Cyanobium sp. PCC 7001]|uniref:hypothetical protein n=1 Tax=Cyanobium sp. PCC 7001 TaxID=180281 RepID=UPI00018056A8|nr:hypothetical protein [Cyanobium sp. PCC 7001]EDY37461.1 conserved hypothetical protein [Cyanobium sp. PCC 7001]
MLSWRTVLALVALSTGLGLAAIPGKAAEQLEQIPAAFHGIWMAEQRHCNAPSTDESWLRIDANGISFYESAGPALAVVAMGPEELGLITELSGEGETWLELLRLRLEAGGRLALESVGAEGAIRRVRCSGL